MEYTNTRLSDNDDYTEVKKQKVEKEVNKASDITDYFKLVSKKYQKTLKSILKQNKEGEKQLDLTKPVNTTTKKIYLHIVVNISLQTDSILACRKVLGKFIMVMKNTDLDAVVTQYEDQSERSNSHINDYKSRCIDSVESIPTLVMQLQQFFPKG